MDDANRFLDNLSSYGIGHLVDDLAVEQKKVVNAVRETGKAGTITLKLSFKRRGPTTVEIDANVTSKIPKQQVGKVEMFADDKNHLHESNPAQLSFGDNVTPIDGKKTVNK